MALSGAELRPGTLYLIPNLLGETSIDASLPRQVTQITARLTHFLVEDEKSARRLIKQLNPSTDLRSLSMERLNEHTKREALETLIAPLSRGHDIGIISEAGCPAIADPGSDVVRLAHSRGARVVPLVGPCSMILALMASGMNGQRWRFVGYLPVEGLERKSEIEDLDRIANNTCETQIAMETPYRNQKLLNDLLSWCRPQTQLCVAQGLTTEDEWITTASIAEWRATAHELRKVPTLFLIGRC